MKTKIGINVQLEIGLDADDGYYAVTTRVGSRMETKLCETREEAIILYCTQYHWYSGKRITPDEVERQLWN